MNLKSCRDLTRVSLQRDEPHNTCIMYQCSLFVVFVIVDVSTEHIICNSIVANNHVLLHIMCCGIASYPLNELTLHTVSKNNPFLGYLSWKSATT